MPALQPEQGSAMIEWSGENWCERSDGYVQTVDVIERPDGESRKLSKKQRKRQKKAKRVPFGFARALPKQQRKR
jgi:hypothetical protein